MFSVIGYRVKIPEVVGEILGHYGTIHSVWERGKSDSAKGKT